MHTFTALGVSAFTLSCLFQLCPAPPAVAAAAAAAAAASAAISGALSGAVAGAISDKTKRQAGLSPGVP